MHTSLRHAWPIPQSMHAVPPLPQQMSCINMLTGSLQVCAGTRHSAALSQAGQAYAWGWNRFGQLGVPPGTESPSVPVLVSGLPCLVTDISSSSSSWHTLFLCAAL